MRSLTRSIGAVPVFTTAPATPPAKKSFMNSLDVKDDLFDAIAR
jgi:hypothetical protein